MSDKTNETLVEKKKPGRKPMTPEERAAAAEARALKKAQADNLKPELFMQYQGGQIDMNTLAEKAKADIYATKKRVHITALTLYVKPEERMVYYVANKKIKGKIPF